jgi:hypothetical protein
MATTETALTIERWRASTTAAQMSMYGSVHADMGLEFDDYIQHLTELGLDECAMVLQRGKVSWLGQGQPGQTKEVLEGLLEDFRHRLYDALKKPGFLALNARERALFEPDSPLFGEDVHKGFPSIIYDIEEAGKCLSLGRSTAAAFHSIRCLEAAIRAISRCLGIPDPTKGSERSWFKALDAIQKKMDEKWPKSGRLSGDGRLFEEIFAALSAAQNPWRNATMHLDQKYTEAEAFHIFEVVGGLMKKLATRTNEDGLPLA